MEDELQAISAELAASIRREMDLEDLVDRLQNEVNNPHAPGKRTSDYFSDSGVSSAKFSDFDQTREEVEKIQRRSEQEKAQVRLELTTKLQDERSKRKVLDQQIKVLSEKASQIDVAQMQNKDASGRLRDLESTCEDLRRKLSDERQVKINFEDLLAALKGELQSAANERDNLRDEIVPQLKARVEGLEVQAVEYSTLTYESTKMQQELQSLKNENEMLRKSTQSSAEPSPNPIVSNVSRSNSVAASTFRLQKPPAGLARSTSVKGVESREAMSDRLKDVEAQRDALHNALKSLLDRQEFQNRENEKKIKALEVERDRLLASSPKKAGYEKDVTSLRHEITVLRRRAEEALEQKWLVEKGLIGLKMDLDRAEEEIASLRSLLEENDILIPPTLTRSSAGSASSFAAQVTSASLEKAYKELQVAYAESLERIKKLELGGATPADEKTKLAVERLEQSLSAAIIERDAAKQEVSDYRTQLDSLNTSEGKHLESERALAEELGASARRVEELAAQVQQQLAANARLRQRLVDAVARGDNERKANADRITGLQSRLKTLEFQLLAAQTDSEERIGRHEEQLTALREAQHNQLRRVSSSPAAGGLLSPRKSSLSPSPLASPLFPRSPRLAPQKSVEEESQVIRLREKVVALEKALADADNEMQDVIAKMSSAQIEVMALQEEREAAVRETRKLQKTLEEERVKAFEQRFRTLSGNA
jgi:chromosome segregation ATPase